MNFTTVFLHIRPGLCGGIGVFANRLVSVMSRHRNAWSFHIVKTFYNLHDYLRAVRPNIKEHLLQRPACYHEDWETLVNTLRPDWIFCPVAEDRKLYHKTPGVRYVTCIADLQHESYPEFFDRVELDRRRSNIRHAIDHSDLIVTISHHSREDILRIYRCDPEQVVVISPGVDLDKEIPPSTAENIRSSLALPESYIIYPANAWPHKNHAALFRALQILKARRHAFPLVLTGHPVGRKNPFTKAVIDYGIEDQVRYLGYLPSLEYRVVLQSARLMVYPSLFEGFGIPVLEAFSLGVPVACSNFTSLPEVAGEAALLFDPNDLEAIANAVERLWADDDLRQHCITQGAARAALYSYDISARLLITRLEEMRRPKEKPRPALTLSEPPLVSIVTPSLNQGRFIRDTIESVLAQDYPRIEYRVVDGGSSDETIPILKSYGDRIAWSSEPDAGQADAINKGLKQARGNVLAYLNSDDTLLPGAVMQVAEHFQTYPQTSLLYGRAYYIDENGHILQEYPTASWDWERFTGCCYICQPAAFWSRHTMNAVGQFDPSIRYVMDYDYWMRVALNHGVIHHIEQFLACSREYPETKTLSGRANIYPEIFAISKKHLGRVDRQWLLGYMHYLLFERSQIGTFLRERWATDLLRAGTLVLQKWHNEDPLSPRLARAVQRRFRAGAINVSSRVLRSMGVRTLLPDRSLEGAYTDGWISPRMTYHNLGQMAPGEIVFEMEVPEPKRFVCRVDGRTVLKTWYESGIQELRVGITDETFNQVEIETTPSWAPNDERPLGFFLRYTNLFTDLEMFG